MSNYSVDGKFTLGFLVVLILFFVLAALALADSIACAKCGKLKDKYQILILHVVTEDKKKLAIPYCPKCYVEVMDSPDLTWAGDE